ncbi:P-loop containing nucleoside triphosphate hydrolase superfamily protein [Tanacetum coccineum]|uniref:P-loop containing nucleoside triphosphate hydrolase superfamily protein n=1 Tax=Tanacetum coccineum TaxID=301880 RepID=A0ABQ5FC69_9ASTR
MEQKHVLLSALSVGVGIGVGVGVGLNVNKWYSGDDDDGESGATAAQIQHELRRLIVDGKDEKITFKDFPDHLSERTKLLLTNAAFVHLKHLDVSKHTQDLSPASRSILLSGPAEFYHQKLAKALSHEFETKLLMLDIVDFSAKIQNKYGSFKKNSDSSFKRSISDMALERMSGFLGSFSTTKEDGRGTSSKQRSGSSSQSRSKKITTLPLKTPPKPSVSSDTKNASVSSDTNLASPKGVSNYPFDEKVFLKELYKVLVSFSETNGIILYIKDVKRFLKSPRTYKSFDKLLKRLSGSILVLGSRISESGRVIENISCLFPYNIVIKPPEDKSHLKHWNEQLEEQKKKIQIQDNKNHIAEVLEAHKLECNELGSICQTDRMLISTYMQEIVVSAISHHLMSHKDPEYRNGKLVISSASLSHGLKILQEDTQKLKTKADTSKELPDNEYEKRIRQEVIPAKEITVTFGDIGALNEIKESLQELVMLPLKRPDLFNGGLLKPCRGVLLFGPPGTGKTMLAKAIAKEAGASFINISASTITSMWHGEDEKNVRAVFSLAAKVSPTIIFLDEVDSMLGQRTRGEHLSRKLKNEFMTHWDGLLTKPGERILVLAATNRPFDLDEAIIRRFERRIMVGLPSVESRESILKTLLAKEKVENLDFKELAVMTEGYSGSDLKNLCVTAAYRPVRELLQQEKQKAIDKMKNEETQASDKKKSEETQISDKKKSEETQTSDKKKSEETRTSDKKISEETQATGDAKDTKEESKNVIKLRHLNMEDMRQAKNQVAASLDEGSVGSIMREVPLTLDYRSGELNAAPILEVDNFTQ